MSQEQVDYLIVGGGPAGTKAAESIREDDPDGRILIVTREPYRLYNRISLPPYIKGSKTRDELFMRPEHHYTEQNIDLWTGVDVVTFDPDQRVATLADGREIAFQKALISSGGTPYPWDIPGSTTPGVTRLNTLDDADKIIELLKTTKEMVIVGGGFISLEFCGIAGVHGKKATVLVREPFYWANMLDELSGQIITKHLERNGITVRTGEEIVGVDGSRRAESLKTKKGETLLAQMVGVGIGVKRNLDFLKDTPIVVEKGVVTDEFLESSVKNIWAAGDVAEFKDVVLGMRHMMGNWKNASDQGLHVGHNMVLSEQKPFEAVSSYGITCFDFHVAFVGNVKPGSAEVIERGDKENSYGRIFVVDGKIVGATLIARPMDRHPLSELIRLRVAVDDRLRSSLRDLQQPIQVPAH